MTRHLNLVENDFINTEKRVLPRFPFCYLTFKSDDDSTRVFEVKDLSHSGMQLSLKMGKIPFSESSTIAGELHWEGNVAKIFGEVKWIKGNRLGVEFSNQPKLREYIGDFLNLEKIALLMKPLHQFDFGVEIPPQLKYWLRADGPAELFVWQHPRGDFSKFQILLLENFIEWVDGEGLKTGRVMSKRNIDTPLLTEDEFVFQIDKGIDQDKIESAYLLCENIPENYLSTLVKDFIKLKLRS